jgi:hypothetical protein
MGTEQQTETTVEIKSQNSKKPIVCPIDPAELAQCDSCQ